MKVKQYRKILLLVLMICAAILFGCVERALGRQLSTQQIASEWSAEDSYAQISCFFSKDAAVTKDYVIQLEQKLKTALQEASEDTSDVNGHLHYHQDNGNCFTDISKGDSQCIDQIHIDKACEHTG